MTFTARATIGYSCLFAAMFGYASLSFTLRHGEIVRDQARTWWLWLPMALVGALFLALRNARLANSGAKRLLILSDVLVIAAGLLVVLLVPDVLGLVKGAIIVVAGAIYITFYRTLLHRGTFVTKDAPAS